MSSDLYPISAESGNRLYLARFGKVFDYIHIHLDEDLSLDRLSEVAAFSKYHFQRQFSHLFGMSVHRYVQLCRFKRATFQLAFRPQQSVIDIALKNGYETPESFARAFKKITGDAPSIFRKQTRWQAWYAHYQNFDKLRKNHMPSSNVIPSVQIIHTTDIKVAVMEHRGDPQLLGDTIRRFIAWRKKNHLPPKVSATFNLLYEHPDEIAAELFHLDLCAAIPHSFTISSNGITEKTIPAGRCARLRHIGLEDHLDASIRYLYADWLPQSGEQLRDFPLYLQRVIFFPDVPEHEAVTDIFLPLI